MKKTLINTETKTTSFINEQANKLLWLLLITYSILVLYGVSNHEPWRDEAQAWLLVRDTNIAELLSILPYEGHPPLWYLLITPIVKLGLPYATQNYLCAAIMIAAMYTFFFRTRLPLLLKCVLPFSYFFLYEYAFFARSYCLIVLFIAAIISLYPQRFNKPWLFALCVVGLFNTHMLLFTFSASLLGLYIMDARRLKQFNSHVTGAIVLMAAGGFYLLPYLVGSKMSTAFIPDISDHVAALLDTIQYGLLVNENVTLAIILLLALMVGIIQRPQLLLLLIGGIAGVFYILVFRYPGSLRHYGAVLMILLAVYGLQENYEISNLKTVTFLKYGYVFLAIVLLLQLKPAIDNYAEDINEPYSDAKTAAAFIKEQHLENKIIVGQDAWAVSAMLPYLPSVKAFYSQYESYGTYYMYKSWYNRRKALTTDRAVNMSYLHFGKRLQDVIIIVNHQLSAEGAKYVDILYASPDLPVRQDEAFYIYKFKEGIK